MNNHQKPVITITGATGFLGSHLMNKLLSLGYRIIVLGRSSKEESLSTRIYKLLDWFGNSNREQISEILEVDLSKPFLRLSEKEYRNLCSKTNQFIHCASDTCFSETKRESVLKFNVFQLDQILNFASDSRLSFFHYISTAYAAGKNGIICREQLSTAKEFVNVYEESKAMAEKVITLFCNKQSIPYTVIRPTIVYGDSKTGRTLKFNAFYYPIRSLLTIRDIYMNDITNHGGKRSLKQGIHIDREGYLHLPLRFHLPQKGGLNLIPVDYFVNMTTQILENPIPGSIFHLSNDNQSSLETLSRYIKEFLKIKGIEVIYGNDSKIKPQNPVEELFDRFMEPYRPYMSDERIFDKTNTNLITRKIKVPQITEEVFKRCMNYAVEVNWGENIFQKKDEKNH